MPIEKNALWYLYSYVVASNYRRKVLLALYTRKKTPKEISKETALALTHVSRALAQLKKVNLVECLTPRSVKGRIWTLTKAGGKISKMIVNNK